MKKPRTTNDTACVRSIDPSGRDRCIALALLLAPTLVAVGWGVLSSSAGPKNAYANVALNAPAIDEPPARTRKASDEQSLASRYCAEVCGRLDTIASPTMLPSLPEVESIDPDEDEYELAMPGVTIGSILHDAQGRPCVYVEGSLYVVGDTISEGWTIASIDLPTRTVTLTHPESDEPVSLSPGR